MILYNQTEYIIPHKSQMYLNSRLLVFFTPAAGTYYIIQLKTKIWLLFLCTDDRQTDRGPRILCISLF